MKSQIMDVAMRFTTPGAQARVEEFFRRDDLEGAISYLYGLFERAWGEDEDEDASEEEKKSLVRHLEEFHEALNALPKVE